MRWKEKNRIGAPPSPPIALGGDGGHYRRRSTAWSGTSHEVHKVAPHVSVRCPDSPSVTGTRQVPFKQIFRPRVLIAIGAALGLLASAAVAGALLRSAPESRHASAPSRPVRTVAPPSSTSTTPTTLPPSTTTTTGLAQPAAATLPPLPAGGLS